MTDNAYPKIRPHGAFYLIPVFSLIIAFVVCFVVILGAALSMSVGEFRAGTNKYIDVKGPETVFIMTYQGTAGSARMSRLEKNRYKVTFNGTTNVEFTFLDVNHPETEITMGEMNNSTYFYVNEYNSVLTINLPAEGYYLIQTKYTSTYSNPLMMAISVGMGRLIKSIFTSIFVVAIGFIAAVISFVVIITRRSFCRRMIREQAYRAQSQSQSSASRL